MLRLSLDPIKLLASCILRLFTVRIHSRIVEKGYSWARLWYLCRGLDRRGSGYVRLPVALISGLLGASSSTIYQWLREGKKAGAFRHYKIQRGILRTHLGGLSFLSNKLKFDSENRTGIAPWGVTAEVPLHEILSLAKLRAAATVATTQRLQQLSRFAAWRNLPAPARKTYRLPQPEAFFVEGQQRLSHDSAVGSIRCCIHISRTKVWVSRGFIHFGTSQTAIAQQRNLSDRTIRRHLALMNVETRQVVQSKAEYRTAAECIARDAGGVEPSEDISLRSSEDGSYYLNEQGLGGRYSHKVGEVKFRGIHSRFFSYGQKPKVWLYRTNLYNPMFKLCTMSATRDNYQRHTTTSARRGGTTACKRVEKSLEDFPGGNAIPAEKDGQNP